MAKSKPKSFDTIAPVRVSSEAAVVDVAPETITVLVNDDVQESRKRHSFLRNPNTFSGPKFRLALFSFLFLLITSSILSFGYLIYEKEYQDRAYLGTKVWGEDVSGKTMPEIQKLLGEKVLNYQLSIKGPDQEYLAKSMDLGLIVNVDEMSTSAINLGRTESISTNVKERFWAALRGLNSNKVDKLLRLDDFEIKPKVEFDQTKFDAYVLGVSDNIKINAQDSEVTVSGSTLQLKPAIYGREVNKDKLISDIRGNISSFKTGEVKVEVSKIKPNIIDNAAEEVMVQAENVMKRPVVLSYQGQEYRPSQETVASWISFKKGPNSSKYELYIDESKMSGYFSFLSTKINIAPVPKKVRIENNVKESVVQEGTDGLAIDKKVLSAKIAAQLPVKTGVKEEIPTYVDKYKTVFERVVVENDEKYIVVDISEQKMTAYLKGGQVVNSWGIVSGNPNSRWGVPGGSPTPIGKWLVMGHSASVNMTDGSYCTSGGASNGTYCLPGVKWVTWFKGGGFAIHSAYWRAASEFGVPGYNNINGSHGCVNSPTSASEFIFNWAPVGTPVYVQE